MLAAITPLIPLLQAIPLHIDSAKASLLNAFQSREPCHSGVPQASLVVRSCSTNKRPRTTSLSGQTPHGSKRSRIDQSVSPPVQNCNDPTTTPKLIPRRPSAHNSPLPAFRSDATPPRSLTPGQKPRAPPDCTLARTSTPARDAAIQISTSLQHVSALGSRTNTQQLATTSTDNVRNPFLRSMTRDRAGQLVQEHSMITFPQSDTSMLRNTHNADTSPMASNPSSIAMLAQQVKKVNELRRTSTQMVASQSKAFPVQGPQGNARQLKSAMTILPSKNIFPPPRRRRSPPVRCRVFVRLSL